MSEEDFNKLFAKNLREQLDKHRLSQKALSEKLNVSVSSVGYWCAGTKIPRMDKINRMCEVFGCERTDLIANIDMGGLNNEEKRGNGIMTNEEHAELFGQNLRHLMYDKNITQADLARMMNVGTSTVSTWYLGRKIPRADKIDRLCNLLVCSRGDLLENPDARTKKAYYADREEAKLAQDMLENPQLRTLLKAARNVSPESLQAIITLIESNKEK